MPQVIPDVNQQINQFIQDVRNNIEGSAWNISSSSDEIMMDISDESDLQIDSNNLNVISGNSQVTDRQTAHADGGETLGHVTQQPRNQPKIMTLEKEAAAVIRDAERSKAKLYEVPGKSVNFVTDTAMMIRIIK